MYGYALLRLIHYIVACREIYPNKRILFSKFDLNPTYRRCHMNYDTTIQSITQDPTLDIVMLILRLTFGGAANPNNFGLISETIYDLANHLLSNSKWDYNKYISPIQDKVPPIESPTEYSPFGKGTSHDRGCSH